MTAGTQKAALQLVLAHEGGYVDHPQDPGGPTNKGITQRVYDAYRERLSVKPRSVRSITSDEVTAIYDHEYWDRAWCDKLPAGLDYAVFDYAVNSGVAKAVRDLQKLCGAAVDGSIGSDTIKRVKAAMSDDEEVFITNYCNGRLKFMKSLRTWGVFGAGWKRRVMGRIDGAQLTDSGVIDYAIAFARRDLSYPIHKSQLPAAIGSKDDEEAPGKAKETDQAALRTPEGVGAAATVGGLGAQQFFGAAQDLKENFTDTPLFQYIMYAVTALMVVGAGLWLYTYFKHRREKCAA